jgi:hypothetical protein
MHETQYVGPSVDYMRRTEKLEAKVERLEERTDSLHEMIKSLQDMQNKAVILIVGTLLTGCINLIMMLISKM